MEEAKIYIAEQRGETVTDEGRLSSTLNYGEYVSPHRHPIGRLLHVNRWTGRYGGSLPLPLPEQSVSVFIPLSTGIVVQVKEHEYQVPLGTLLVLPVGAGAVARVGQAEADEGSFVFQQFVLAADSPSPAACIYTLPIAGPSGKNRMMPVLKAGMAPFHIHIGAFIGKVKSGLALDPAFQHVFVLTLDGNFEVEERLLFAEDALLLIGLQELGSECLSDTGILLAFQF